MGGAGGIATAKGRGSKSGLGSCDGGALPGAVRDIAMATVRPERGVPDIRERVKVGGGISRSCSQRGVSGGLLRQLRQHNRVATGRDTAVTQRFERLVPASYSPKVAVIEYSWGR